MSRTYKSERSDKNFISFKASTKKQFKKRSHKKMRHTPVTKEVLTYKQFEQEVTIRISRNIVKGGIPTLKEVKVNIIISIPYFEEIEIMPEGLDIWEIE